MTDLDQVSQIMSIVVSALVAVLLLGAIGYYFWWLPRKAAGGSTSAKLSEVSTKRSKSSLSYDIGNLTGYGSDSDPVTTTLPGDEPAHSNIFGPSDDES